MTPKDGRVDNFHPPCRSSLEKQYPQCVYIYIIYNLGTDDTGFLPQKTIRNSHNFGFAKYYLFPILHHKFSHVLFIVRH